MFTNGQLDDQRKWRKMITSGPSNIKAKKNPTKVYDNNLDRWTALVSKMIEPSLGSLLTAIQAPRSRTQGRWDILIEKLLKRNPTIGGNLWANKFTGLKAQAPKTTV